MTIDANSEKALPTFELMPGADPFDENEDLGNIEGMYDHDDIAISPSAEEPSAEEPSAEEAPAEEAPAEEPPAEEPPAEEALAEEPPAEEPPAEEPPAEEPLAEEPPRPRNVMVPKTRMDAEAAKRRTAEARIQELERELSQAQNPTVDPEVAKQEMANLLKASNEALLDGDLAKATELQQQVFDMQASTAATAGGAQETIDAQSIREQVKEEMRVETILTDVMDRFPALNAESPDYDEALYTQAVELQDFYLDKGYTLSQAVERGVELAIQSTRPDLLAAPTEETPPAVETPAPAKPRKTKTVKEKIAAANAQPPEPQGLSSAAHSEDTIDVSKLSIEEYEALPESTLARLRGDTLA